jgi:heme exporter protein D
MTLVSLTMSWRHGLFLTIHIRTRGVLEVVADSSTREARCAQAHSSVVRLWAARAGNVDVR